MIWKIAKKEFLLNLMTFKFAAGAVLCVVLTGVWDIGLLGLFNLVFFAAAFLSFLKYDVR
jgi:hypothetical protein